MYYDFFGFREPPFSIAPDPRYLYLTERHKEALTHLMYGVQGQGGFIVITGEVGTGKTTISRCFIENVPENVDIALILNPRLTARELLSAICDELEISHDPGASIKQLVDLINQDLLRAHAAGRHKVLIIDEAQNLSADVLEQLRLLTNLETAEKKLLQIVLLGQPELQDMLALPELRQLNQRVTARYHLGPISRRELPAYLRYRLGVAGMRGNLFTAAAVRRVYWESRGIPRVINLVCDRALLGAYAEGSYQVEAGHVGRAAREIHGRTPALAVFSGIRLSPRLWLVTAVLVAVVLAAVSATYWLSGADIMAAAGEGQVQRAAASGADVTAEPVPVAFDFNSHTLPERTAYATLFRVWGRNYPAATADAPCTWARSVGLGCLRQQGARRSLEYFDRPALLALREKGGESGYVVLRHLDGDVAELWQADGAPVTVSFRDLAKVWFGGFVLLWQLPEYMDNNGFYGGNSGRQLWLDARMMELVDRLLDNPQERARIKRLPTVEQVRWFQARQGLAVDGIAGAMTIIQMHNELGVPVPRLVPVRSEAGGR